MSKQRLDVPLSSYSISARNGWWQCVFQKNEGGLDFGVRLSFHVNAENTGVDKIVEPVESTSAAEMVANDRISKGLKYDIPKLCDFAHVKLKTSEIEFLRKILTMKNDWWGAGILAITGMSFWCKFCVLYEHYYI